MSACVEVCELSEKARDTVQQNQYPKDLLLAISFPGKHSNGLKLKRKSKLSKKM